MEMKDVFQLYEKLYFHEIDSREKLNSRLQTPLTLIVSFVGVLAFLLQNYGHKGFSITSNLFFFLIFLSTVALTFAAVFFVKSWYNNTYSFLPSAQVSEDYRQTLIKLYEPYENGAQLASDYFSSYVMEYYIRYSSANTLCNDRRSIYLHKTNGALITTAAVAFLAFLAFFFGDLDKAHINKPTEISIVSPVTFIGGNMPDQPNSDQLTKVAPPPPPPPPPPRQIREGVEVIKHSDVVPTQSGGKTDGK
jgi:magnesium-transporting ATPase (P-type)